MSKFYCKCGMSFRKKHYFLKHSEVCYTKKYFDFLKPYLKTSFEGIEFINNVPKVVYVCWFGVKDNEFPLMSERRFNAFKSLVENINVPVILMTIKNFKNFIKPNYPLHETFDNLTGVHKSDYFRCYLLKHYGGGYHDIKYRNEGWENCWKKDNWLDDDNIWMYGRREKYEGAIAYSPEMNDIRCEYKKLATMGWIICKPNTKYINELVINIERKLDYHKNNLNKYPGNKPEGYHFQNTSELVPSNSYPIRWLEILGEIFHPLMLKYTKHIKFGLPDAIKKKRYK